MLVIHAKFRCLFWVPLLILAQIFLVNLILLKQNFVSSYYFFLFHFLFFVDVAKNVKKAVIYFRFLLSYIIGNWWDIRFSCLHRSNNNLYLWFLCKTRIDFFMDQYHIECVLIDWFLRHVNASGVISYQKIKELRTLYVSIYTFVLFFVIQMI